MTRGILLVTLLTAGAAMGGINTDKELGPLNMYIAVDGTATIVNDGEAVHEFQGYSIDSAGGLIACNAWITIFEQALTDPVDFPPSIGQPLADALKWITMADRTTLISEAILATPGVSLQPGGSLCLGPVFPGGTQADLTFRYVNCARYSPTGLDGSWEGRVIPAPEPGAMMLLTLGGLAVLRGRRGAACRN